MSKSKFLVFFTLVIASFALFATTHAMAQDGDCYAPDFVQCGDCTLTAVRGLNGEFPVPVMFGDTTWYKVEYEYSGTKCDVQSFDHVYFTLEYNECYIPINVKPQDGLDYYVSGDGGGDNNFALGVHNTRVIRINPQGNKAFFYVDTDRLGKSSSRWTAGRKSTDCDGPIISVGYDPVRPPGPLTSKQCIGINERLSMGVARGPDGCQVDAYEVKFWLDNPTCTSGTGILLDTAVVVSTELVCSGLDAKGCPECIRGDGGHSPTYYHYYTPSGYKVTVCYDLANPPTYACP